MQDRQLKYGFTVIVPEQMLTVPSLWQITRLFQTTHNLTAGHLQNFVQHGVWNTCSYWCALQNKHYPQHSLVISERLQAGILYGHMFVMAHHAHVIHPEPA